jgi:hypothetical protein
MKKNNNNFISKKITNEFNSFKYQKNLQLILKNIFTKNSHILYVLNGHSIEEQLYRELIFKKQKSGVYFWTPGLITNFGQVLKSYFGNKGLGRQENLLYLDWKKVNKVLITKIPDKNSSLFKELLILKTELPNIKIIGFININNDLELSLCKKNNQLIDTPLYYNGSISDKIFLYFTVFKYMVKHF